MFKNHKKYYSVALILISVSLLNAVKFAPKEEFKNPILKDSKEDGGLGFDEIADIAGWQTSKNIKTGDPRATKGGSLTMLGGAEFPRTFRDIGVDTRHQINSLMSSLQYEALLSFDYEDLEYKPNLATHWKIEPDSLTFRFRIDPNAKWSDGRDITSNDVVAYLRLILDPGHEDPNTSRIMGELFELPVAESKYIVKVVAKKKDWRSFRYAASFTPLPSFYLDKIDGAGYIEKYNDSFMPVSGPYKYDEANTVKGADGVITFKRRTDYWAKDYKRNIGFNNFDQIRFIFIMDENQQQVSFFNGEFDMYSGFRAQWWVELFNEKEQAEISRGWIHKIKIFNSLPKGPSGIVFNTKKAPWDDIKVRKAFAHLFDVEKLNKRLFFNEYSQLNTFFFGTPYANPRNPFTEYNPEKALSLLNEAGWVMEPGETWLSKNGKKFEFEFLIATGGERIYSSFQDDLSKVGIKMTFNQMDNIGKFSSTMKKEFEVTSQGWTAGFFPSPEGMMHSKFAEDIEVTNITSMAIPEMDKLIDMYNAEWDAKKRVPLAHKIDSIAINSYHYAMGWTSPYGLRMMYWNKFGIPETGISYIGDWMAPIFMWWNDPEKEIQLEKAISSQLSLDKSNVGKKSSTGDWNEIDYWNKKP